MSDHTVEKEVNADPAKVWSLVTDIDSYPEMIRSIIHVHRLDDHGKFAVGTRWCETRKMFGSEATEEMSVTHLDPGKSYTVEAESHGAHYTSVISVEPTSTGSSLKMTFKAKPTNLVARLLAETIGRLFEHSTHKTLAHDLDDIAAAAEAD